MVFHNTLREEIFGEFNFADNQNDFFVELIFAGQGFV